MGKELILKELKALIEKATKEECWFLQSGQDVLISPQELEKANREGRFIWSANQWELIPVRAVEERYKGIVKKAQDMLDVFYERSGLQNPKNTVPKLKVLKDGEQH